MTEDARKTAVRSLSICHCVSEVFTRTCPDVSNGLTNVSNGLIDQLLKVIVAKPHHKRTDNKFLAAFAFSI